MRKKIGILFLIAGIICISASCGFLIHNTNEGTQAAEASVEILPLLHEYIDAGVITYPTEFDVSGYYYEPWSQEQSGESAASQSGTAQQQSSSKSIRLDGRSYIGIINIPALELELPVITDWSYPNLKVAPCRYSGSPNGDDLVLCAHNYKRHFGYIKNLQPGDLIIFTDALGYNNAYIVQAVETLEPTDVENMTSGEYDLTLFTCTYGGQARVTVRCMRYDPDLMK